MTDQPRLFVVEVAQEKIEQISEQRGRSRRQKAMLKMGVHPATRVNIADGVETCGSCAHLVVRSRNRTYFKCGLMPETHGPGTDIRKKWPACTEWKENADG